MNRPKRIGRDAENAVVAYLRAHGWPEAERRAQRGSRDAGDLTGCPGLCVEVKGGEAAKNASDLLVADWLEETEKERVNAGADIGVLVLQRRGVGPANAGRWWAVMPVYQVVQLVYGRCTPDPPYVVPVRMHLAAAVDLLRFAGFGDPLTATEVTH
jgi:hypothetical protein